MEKANSNVRTVHFMCARGFEDLSRCQENGRVYARQKCGRDYVRWLTTALLSSGSYECLAPMRSGLLMRVVDAAGTVLYEETICKVEGISDTCAVKAGDFSSDAIRQIAESYAKQLELQSYASWKAWMKKSAEVHQYQGYFDNWRYAGVEYSPRETLCATHYLGKRVYITCEKAVHKISGQTWECVEVRDKNKLEVLAICGYKFQD